MKKYIFFFGNFVTEDLHFCVKSHFSPQDPYIFASSNALNGCGMLVLVSPCFRENVVVTCKIGSFLCSLDTLLHKNIIAFFFENQISKWRSFEKKRLFWPTFHTFLVTREKLHKFLQHISHSHTYICITLTLSAFFALPILKKKKYKFIINGFSLVWFLVLILIRTILEQSVNNKMVSKFKLECLLTDMYLH